MILEFDGDIRGQTMNRCAHARQQFLLVSRALALVKSQLIARQCLTFDTLDKP